MTGVAHFDREGFGAKVAQRVAATGKSYRQIHDAYPWISINTISRAVKAKPLSQPNFMALCDLLGIDPKSFFSVRGSSDEPQARTLAGDTKEKQIQTVPVAVSRETRGMDDILKSMRGTDEKQVVRS